VRKADLAVATVASNRQLIEAVATEMSEGIDCAVEFWIGQIEQALDDPELTTLGRLYAVRAIVQTFRHQPTEMGFQADGYVA
jgi:ubiquinone biosynthesis protein UbiJ